MDYLIRFVQLHETFRKPEIDALAEYARIQLHWEFHSEDVRGPFTQSSQGPEGSKIFWLAKVCLRA